MAIPTETVYGLGADADDGAAVARIFAAKGRPADHPLIVHLAGPESLPDWAAAVPPAATVLAEACWPGPLTLLLPRAARVLDAVTGGRDTVGLRVPAHPLTEALLRRSGRGVAAPSANRFGRVSPTTAAHVVADLGPYLEPGRDVVLDGGPAPVGVESTIVDCTTDPPQLLRPGGIPTEDVERLLDAAVAPARGRAGPPACSTRTTPRRRPWCWSPTAAPQTPWPPTPSAGGNGSRSSTSATTSSPTPGSCTPACEPPTRMERRASWPSCPRPAASVMPSGTAS